MPISKLLKSAAGTCPFCRQKAGILARAHRDCRRTFDAGWEDMVRLVAQAVRSSNFNEQALRRSLTQIAHRSYRDSHSVNQALEEGWNRVARRAGANGNITREEETMLRDFRNRLAMGSNSADPQIAGQLDRASEGRLMTQAQEAALSARNGNSKIDQLSQAMRDAGLDRNAQFQLVRKAWETAVDTTLYKRLLTQDEEDSLKRYINHFGLTPSQLNGRGMYRDFVNSAMLRGISHGRLPPKHEYDFIIPFNLMKSEQLVWVIRDAEYLETVTRREREGTSHGLSVRVAKGMYYRPGTFRSRTVEWDETVHADTGLLGFTTKHLYFAGSRKKFRVRYDKIVALTPYDDGLGIMRDAMTAKPQTFRTGDGWFAYNLAVNLAQM